MQPSASKLPNRRAIRQALSDWRAQDRLRAPTALATWRETEPRAADWRQWLDHALLALGAGLACAGVLVFFAFNWQDLHKFARFGLLAGAISLLAALAWWRPAGDLPGQAALGGAQLLAGVLLAVIGQTYQTGADAWQLFALWALLAIPWALAARAAPLWWLVIVVGNVALLRYCSIRPGLGGALALLFDSQHARVVTLGLLGAALLQLALWLALRATAPGLGFRGQTGARLLGALACGYAGWAGLAALFGQRVNTSVLLLAALALVALGWWFRQRAFDIVALSVVSLTGIVLAIATAGRVLFAGRFEYASFLLLGLLTVGLATAAAMWLMRAYRTHTGEMA